MARTARIVAPGMAHHVTQRGNRKMETFLRDDDYGVYLGLMKTWCNRHRVRIQAYCLMPNHVHLIAVPQTPDGLSRGEPASPTGYWRYSSCPCSGEARRNDSAIFLFSRSTFIT